MFLSTMLHSDFKKILSVEENVLLLKFVFESNSTVETQLKSGKFPFTIWMI